MSSKRKFEEEEEAGTSSSRKLRSYDEPTPQTAFETLPIEIIDEIFQYLARKDILNMALVSKTFSSFVSTSSMVMNRFPICLDMKRLRSLDKLIVGERNYTKVIVPRILTSDLPLASKLLQKFGPCVKEIEVDSILSKTVLIRILKICKNVEILRGSELINHRPDRRRDPKIINMWQIYFYGSSPQRIEESKLAIEAKLLLDPAPMDLANLKTLECYVGTTPLALFGNCKLKEISFHKYHDRSWTHFDIYEFKKFLEKQNSLQCMKLKLGCSIALFIEDMSAVGFRLKSLEMGRFDDFDNELHVRMNLIALSNFCAFIKLHESTLERLKCENLSMLHHFSDFKLLTRLELNLEYTWPTARNLVHIWISQCNVMPQVKSLAISMVDENVAKTFPNLKELESTRIYGIINCHGIEKCINVEKLILKFVIFFPYAFTQALRMPNLKQLELVNYPFNRCPVDIVMTQLEELTIESAKVTIDWLIDFLQLGSTKLNQLKLVNMKLIPTIRTVIDNNRHKIKNLVLTNVTFHSA